MEFAQWLSLVSVCLLGAMSPGPSLAMIINTSLRGGRTHGVAAALAHGAGIGVYALLAVAGLAALLVRSSGLFLALQLAGAGYLLYLGTRSLRSAGSAGLEGRGPVAKSLAGAARDGFLVAFLNPKVAVFVLALFSQFLRPGAATLEKGVMALTIALTDAGWYTLMALMVSHPAIYRRLARASQLIDRVFGMLLILIALAVSYSALA